MQNDGRIQTCIVCPSVYKNKPYVRQDTLMDLCLASVKVAGVAVICLS